MSHSTQVAVATLALLAAIVYAWRRFGFLGGVVVAVAGAALAGTYVPAIHDFVISAARVGRTPFDLVIQIVD
jgi:hypothetical protein